MNDIELVIIKIARESYNNLKIGCTQRVSNEEMIEALINGKILPKGHGRLIILSEDAVKREQVPLSFSCQKWISEVGLSNATVAIIEAERSDKE